MSSEDAYFGEDDLDEAALQQLDAIEAAHFSPAKSKPFQHPPLSDNSGSDTFDMSFDINDSEFARIDDFIAAAYQGMAGPAAAPNARPQNGSVQTTLFGEVLPASADGSKTRNVSNSRKKMQRTTSSVRNPFGQQARKTKTWDHTEFAKSGLKRGKSKGKGKGGTLFNEDEGEEEDEPIEFEQFPAPFVSVGPPPPMKHAPDLLEAKHWIYPLNQPKRDYQCNIVKHCLFENTLVALPTGLGKTFIAGVVMLNFYRWFPTGKVVFVAPTKPLVAQQIDACHKTCGIPGSHAVELTGQNPRLMRARAWQEKRVFYMTPQTLVNDLTTENCDVRDIVLVVIDEAHKGTGDYAYAQVIRYLMAKNPHFRVLALTATPGSTPDAVQAIVDALHISRIELRDEESLDLKDYIHKKDIKQHIIAMTDDVNRVKDLLVKIMDSIAKPLQSNGVLYRNLNPVHMSSFLPRHIMSTLNKNQKWAYGPLSMLSTLARAMGYLVEGTMGMCSTYLEQIALNKDGDGDKFSSSKKLAANPMFKAILSEIHVQQCRPKGFSVHPKMERLKAMVIQHFGERIGDNREGSEDETRVMVFATYRECVDEIVAVLNEEKPLIRATRFVGQGTDKQGKRGIAQKEQLEVITKFKEGEYNVLVATSIGEEGLDIGEIDMIVCYDAQKTPIRMLQRVGRTGRKRDGFVHVLLSEVREELNLDKAKATYKEVQKSIVCGESLALYADVERLLPDHIRPAYLEKEMDIEEYVREDGRKKSFANDESSPAKGKKRKRDDDVQRNIPAGASSGFVSVKDLLVKASAITTKKKKMTAKRRAFGDMVGEDDDIDLEIQGGLEALRRDAGSLGSHENEQRGGKGRKKLRKVKTMGDNDKRKHGTTATKRQKSMEPTSSQILQRGVDDSDDMDIESGIVSRTAAMRRADQGPLRDSLKSPLHMSSSLQIPRKGQEDVIELTMSDQEEAAMGTQRWNNGLSPVSSRGHPSDEFSPANDPSLSVRQTSPIYSKPDDSMAWLVDDDDDDDLKFQIADSSPILDHLRPALESPSGADDSEIEFVGDHLTSMPPTKLRRFAPRHRPQKALRRRPNDSAYPSQQLCHESIVISEDKDVACGTFSTQSSSPLFGWDLSPEVRELETRKVDVPPDRIATSSPTRVESSFPVRPVGQLPKKRTTSLNRMPSSPLEPSHHIPRRLRRKNSISPSTRPPAQRKAKKSDSLIPQMYNPLLDMEAIHSGDELSAGSSPVDDEESESDQVFLQAPMETQVSASYDQTMVYRQSLLTQAPLTGRAPIFMNGPFRRHAFTTGPRRMLSSSPTREDGEPNEYVMGSFVVDDDSEIVASDV